MTHASTEQAASAPTTVVTTIRTVQLLAVLSVINLAFQFVTAGELFPRGGPLELHSWGAIVLHVVTGLTAVAAAWHQRVTRGPAWPTTLGVVVFVLSFVQAYFGDRDTLYLHVPGAIILTIGSVWVLAWSFSPTARHITL